MIVALAASALSACGGGENDSSPRTTAPSGVAAGEQQLAIENAYDNGLDTCSQYDLKVMAGTYGVKPTPEAVAKAVAKNAGTSAEIRRAAEDGCLAAFAAR